ncbi:unnamed protein product [Paramecium sonneborni]|uniref:Ubiquitin-activating enzyme E1 C-terminal domain-containing protein n=1 Tax=Paramecium sonneborni TaxID=65129 RepID=A0A8S1RT09_9CILI|nr:unnamed protein product [Paramecium sonneborni]
MNGHIDFIPSQENLRAFYFGLDEMDWINVKLKAGRIVPALATTTPVVSGLQSIELVKDLKKCKLENMKNRFINLAVSIVQLTEPMKDETIKLNEEINVTLWDRWEVRLGKEITLKSLFQHLKQTYHLEPTNVFKQSSVIYMHDLHKGQNLFTQPIFELLDVKTDYLDLVINLVKDEQILKNVPEVKVQPMMSIICINYQNKYMCFQTYMSSYNYYLKNYKKLMGNCCRQSIILQYQIDIIIKILK